MPNFTVTGDWTALLPGAALAGDVRFQQFGSTDTVPADIHAAIKAGVLVDATGASPVALPAPNGGVIVTGGNGGPYTVTFSGPLAKQNVAQLTATPSFSGGTAPAVAIATQTAGTPTVDEVQTVTINGAPTGGTFTLTFSGQTTAAIPFNATALQVQAALLALSTIGTGGVLFYWASFNNLTIEGFTVPPTKVLFQAKAANGVVDLDSLRPQLFAAA